jgi:NADH-quinone oxidoreductase subunit G
VLAAATFAEKAGCYVNADGRIQYAEASLPPREGALPDLDLLSILLGRARGPVRSRDVLAELAGAVPSFAVAEGGRVPPFGVLLEKPEPVTVAVPFADAWMKPRGEKGDRPGEPSPKGSRNA